MLILAGRITGIDFQGLIILLLGLHKLSICMQGQSFAQISLLIIGVDHQGLIEESFGILIIAQGHLGDSLQVEGLFVIRIQSNGTINFATDSSYISCS